MTRRLVAIGCIVAALLPVALASAQNGGATISDIVVTGNQSLSREAVLYHVRSRVGQAYDARVVQADEQRLLETGRFRSVRAYVDQTDAGMVLTFDVAEHAVIDGVSLVGNKKIKTTKLTRELPYAAGDPFNAFTLEANRKALLAIYRRAGHQFVEVTQTTTGRDVTYTIVEGPKVSLRAVRFEGNTHYRNWELRQRVATSAGLMPKVMKSAFSPDEVDQDIQMLRQLYVSEGFLGVEVSHRLEYSPDKAWITVTFVIAEHDRYRVNAIQFEGNTAFGDDQLVQRVELVQGDFVRAVHLRRSREALVDSYGEVGYIEATVEINIVYVDPSAPLPAWARSLPEQSPALVNLVFRIVEKDQYFVGVIDIRGNTVTQERVIRRDLRFFPEQPFDAVAIREARQRLMDTRLFEKVNIVPVGGLGNIRNILVEVVEARTAEFLIGVGVSTNSGLLGSISYRENNFDISAWPWMGRPGPVFKGAGQKFSIVAEPGVELMRFNIEWFEPSLFDGPNTLGVKGFVFTRGRENYDELRAGPVVSFGRRFMNQWYGELAARVEMIDITGLSNDAPPEVTSDAGNHLIAGLKATLVRDRTDSRWMPSTGDRMQFSYEQIVGAFNFGRLDASYKIYRTVYVDSLDRRHVVAGRAAIGHIFGDAPVFERYYGGGLGSVRGFKYRGISPRSSGTDEPIGGEFLLMLGGEYIFPIFGEQLKGVVFVDTGTVESTIGISNFRASVGAGLRWIVPLLGPVPVSLDFAIPLVRDSNDETQLIAFFVGWAY